MSSHAPAQRAERATFAECGIRLRGRTPVTGAQAWLGPGSAAVHYRKLGDAGLEEKLHEEPRRSPECWATRSACLLCGSLFGPWTSGALISA